MRTEQAMSTDAAHLSETMLDGLAMDAGAPEMEAARRHVAACVQCAAALAEERARLGGFARSSTAMADAAMERLVMRPPAVPAGRWSGVRSWLLRPVSLAGVAAATGAVVVAVAIGGQEGRLHPAAGPIASATVAAAGDQRPAVAQTLTAEGRTDNAADDALLLDVGSELSTSVASPLAPLSDPLQKSSKHSIQQN